jgi:hypothetical protein
VTYVSAPEDLSLLAVRTLGFPTPARVAARYGLDLAAVEEALLDFEALGWARHTSFGGRSGWSATEAGRVEVERRLTAELDQAGARQVVTAAHIAFRPLNRRVAHACTDWQIRPTRLDPMAFNDHTDWPWDERVLKTLASAGAAFRQLCEELAASLARFGGYADRYFAALAQVDAGHRAWVDAPDRDSCHLIWMQFHEDLLATLNLSRESDTAAEPDIGP